MIIRNSNYNDREAVIDLIWELNRFEFPISRDRVRDRAGAARCLRDNDEAVRHSGGISIIADVDGQIVGYLCLAVESIGNFVRDEVRRVGFVRELIVAQTHRRGGIGQALLQEAENYCLSSGIRRLMLGVLAGNASAYSAYEKFGMKPYAIEMIKDFE